VVFSSHLINTLYKEKFSGINLRQFLAIEEGRMDGDWEEGKNGEEREGGEGWRRSEAEVGVIRAWGIN
jgi:hypothetical protein